MTHPLRRAFSPSSYAHGRPAAIAALLYLAVVAVATAVTLLGLATADPARPTFSVSLLLLVTMPTSLIVAEPVAALTALFAGGGASAAVALVVALALGGVLQAAAIFLLFRGGRLSTTQDRRAPHA